MPFYAVGSTISAGAAVATGPATDGPTTKATTMAATVTVRLPDGSARELATGSTAGDLAAAIGSGLARAAVAAVVDGREVDLSTELPDGAEVAMVTADVRRRPGRAAALDRPRAGPGRAAAVAGRPLRHRPGHRGRLLLRLRAARRRPLQRRRPRADRGHDARRSWPRTSRSSAHEHTIDEGLALFADQPFKREIIEAVGRAGRADEVGDAAGRRRRGTADRCRTYWNSPTFADLCRGPHVPSTGRLGHFSPHAGGRRLLAGRREAPAAAAHLRHGVGVGQGAGRAPAPAGGGRAAGPPQARRRARPVLLPRGDRLRAWPSSIPRAAPSAG